jgi:hypothetical protein
VPTQIDIVRGVESNFASKLYNFSLFSAINARHTGLLLFIVQSIFGISREYGSQKAIVCQTWHNVRDGGKAAKVRQSANESLAFMTEIICG